MIKLLILFLALSTPLISSAGESWNFTRADYQKLRSQGGELQFSQDSVWFPEAFRKNLLATLNYVLSENVNPSTDGVNLNDFYHGHIGCDSKDFLAALQKDFNDANESSFNQRGVHIYQLDHKNEPAVRQLLKEALLESEIASGDRLSQLYAGNQCDRLSVIYHTYELKRPQGMADGDPRRHIKTDQNDLRPQNYKPLAPMNVMSLSVMSPSDAAQDPTPALVAHFGFLVDKAGFIHVTVGSRYQLQFKLNVKTKK